MRRGSLRSHSVECMVKTSYHGPKTHLQGFVFKGLNSCDERFEQGDGERFRENKKKMRLFGYPRGGAQENSRKIWEPGSKAFSPERRSCSYDRRGVVVDDQQVSGGFTRGNLSQAVYDAKLPPFEEQSEEIQQRGVGLENKPPASLRVTQRLLLAGSSVTVTANPDDRHSTDAGRTTRISPLCSSREIFRFNVISEIRSVRHSARAVH